MARAAFQQGRLTDLRLDSPVAAGNGARVQRQPSLESSTQLVLLLSLAVVFVTSVALHAAMPLSSATVTRVENKVSYGQVRGDRSDTRLARPQDVIKASDFLLSESDSRAELKYEDGSIIRIGQNTIFTFDAKNRVLNLQKGTLVFYIPKGAGGATIKTPSITAAITGTVGKVSETTVAIVEGEVVILPGMEKVGKFQFARRNGDGTLTIGFFDPAKAYDGKLMTFNGKIQGIPDLPVGEEFRFNLPPNDPLDNQNVPSEVMKNNPPPVDKPKTDVKVPPPTTDTKPTATPYY